MWKAGMKWLFLILGTMIGAGYASGRELWQFFGDESGLAILLFVIMFIISCTVIMTLSYEKRATDYLYVLEAIVGKRLVRIYDYMILLYLFTTTVVMIAGSGATVQAFQLNYWWGVILISVVLLLLFIKDINAVLSINQFIIPLLLVGLLFVLLQFTIDQQLPLLSPWSKQSNWAAAFPFTALNVLPLVAVLGAIGTKVQTKGEIWIASIGSGVVFGIISYIYNNSLIQIADEILLYEIPLFAILKNYSANMLFFMSILLWIAIFTTAAAGILGIVTRIKRSVQLPIWLLVLLSLACMLPLTIFGFSTLIAYIYPAYGILNLYILTRLVFFPLFNNRKYSNN
ncbi:YkvI family membrane protein [Virgibacillus sp. W0430]|uniref:YkvI family membrane protein n=1 Tax=Virgibacillus sp. W0430 TaxID=3391580 RepID=UPI003F464578